MLQCRHLVIAISLGTLMASSQSAAQGGNVKRPTTAVAMQAVSAEGQMQGHALHLFVRELRQRMFAQALRFGELAQDLPSLFACHSR